MKFLIILIFIPHEIYSQNDFEKIFYGLYQLPDIKSSQLSKVRVKMKYKLSLEKISENKYKVWAKYTFVPFNTKIWPEDVGEYNYKYNGKWYNSDEMWSVDPRTEDGFMNTYGFIPDIKITMVSMTGTIINNTEATFFGRVSDDINTNSALVGIITHPKELNHIMITKLNTKVNYVIISGTKKLHERIKLYELKINKNKSFQDFIKKANGAFKSKNYEQAKMYYEEALKIYPKNLHAKLLLIESVNNLKKSE